MRDSEDSCTVLWTDGQYALENNSILLHDLEDIRYMAWEDGEDRWGTDESAWVDYGCWSELEDIEWHIVSGLLHEIAVLKAEVERLRLWQCTENCVN